MKILTVFNSERQNGEKIALKCSDILKSAGAEVTVTEFKKSADLHVDCDYSGFDTIVAVGGDGTILKVAKTAAMCDKPVIGVNIGRIGYLASLNSDNLNLLTNLVNGDYSVENRMMLNVELSNNGKVITTCECLNDAVISKSTLSNMIDISVVIGNESINYRSDGFIVSTPTGSTAYSMSAGGPVVDPILGCMILTPVCPHTLMSRSMVINGDSEILIHVGGNSEGESYFFADGRGAVGLKNGSVLKISCSKKTAKFIKLNDLSVYKVFSEKSRL